MANPQHAALARLGPHAIARWREQHYRSRERLDLSSAHLSRAKLPNVDLAFDELSGIDLTDADLSRSQLGGSNLRAAHLSRANLSWINLKRAKLTGAALVRANLRGSCLRGVDLQGADLSHADLSSADLRDANLAGADLTEANLSWADLTGALLTKAKLTSANLDVANVTRTDFRGASLIRTRLNRTLFSEAMFELTLVADCDLSQALRLDSARHLGPSIIGVDTLTRSKGEIPELFLRRAGVPPSIIAMQEHLRESTENHSRVLLISSMGDVDLVNRLESDLRSEGIACWRLMIDEENALRSNSIFPTNQRFTYCDQMVLVCSENSLDNPFGWRFFEQLAQRPTDLGNTAVVTLAVDDALYSRQDELCENLRKHGVVDFRGSNQIEEYRKGFGEVLAALQCPETDKR